jgi:hypothetical protein
MPHGFFTVEQWQRPQNGAKPRWIPVLHLDSNQSLTRALRTLEKHGKPGLYQVTQTQRCIWAEMEKGKLRLHGSHVSSPGSLARLTEIYEREDGHRPVEKARQERVKAKASRAKK